MASTSEEQIHDAYLKWLKPKVPSKSIAVTVTFNPTSPGTVISKDSAEAAVRVFCRKLNTKAFGNKYRNKEQQLAIIPIHEGGRSTGEKHPHCHFLIEVPDGWTTQLWTNAAEELIFRMRSFSHTQYDVKPTVDSGWLEYILKKRDKKIFSESVDLVNLWVNT